MDVGLHADDDDGTRGLHVLLPVPADQDEGVGDGAGGGHDHDVAQEVGGRHLHHYSCTLVLSRGLLRDYELSDGTF